MLSSHGKALTGVFGNAPPFVLPTAKILLQDVVRALLGTQDVDYRTKLVVIIFIHLSAIFSIVLGTMKNAISMLYLCMNKVIAHLRGGALIGQD
ncbi:hypothetical protein EYZ11_005437 [Aspergillus tanneri]|uniref:Uncharacterized protein n=1 Tax=Aspergillus tanneri TaxID=1220188 RepID=A0A4S3JHY3_9EURO|nr:hypothetical protein EYZ11_005437 [Aspergillus tanneri]